MKRHGSAEWNDGLKDGKGTVSTESGVLKSAPYSFKTRFEEQQGTNPEELIGAAHAGCFSKNTSSMKKNIAIALQKIQIKPANTTIKNRFSQKSAKPAGCCHHM